MYITDYRHDKYGGLIRMICDDCGTFYAISASLHETRKKRGGSWACPNGHKWNYTETDNELEQARASAASLRTTAEELRQSYTREVRRNNSLRGQITRLNKKKR